MSMESNLEFLYGDSDYKLEYKVEAKEEEKVKSLYSWYISEVDQENNEVTGLTEKCIPYLGSVRFLIKDIYIDYQTEIEFSNYNEDENSSVTREEKIHAKLKVDNLKVDNDYNTKLSMFGTNRIIEDIHINVYKSEEEYCRVLGSPESDSSDSYYLESIPDFIEISVGLKEFDYKDMVERIKNKSISTHFITLKGVLGFYSRWSPEISVPIIKVLTSEHKVDIPKNFNYQLPRLGEDLTFRNNADKNVSKFLCGVREFSWYSRFSYELTKDTETQDEEQEEPRKAEIPLTPGERIQEETKEEVTKLLLLLLSVLQKQQKYIFWGFLTLIIAIFITNF